MNSTGRLLIVFANLTVVAGCFAQNSRSQVEHGEVAIDVSPDSEQIAFSAADGELYLFRMKSSDVRQLSKTDAVEHGPRFSPDGKKIAYTARSGGTPSGFVFTRSLDSPEVQQLTNTTGVTDSAPSFSPDGSRIAFARAHRHRPYSMGGMIWDQWDIYVMNADGTDARRVTQEKYYLLNAPAFSHDGQKIVFAAEAVGKNTAQMIFEVEVSGDAPPKPLTGRPTNDTGAWATDPGISPDGSRIAFISDRGKPFHYDIYLMSRDGANPTALNVLNVSRYNQSPVFMPDSRHLVFLAGTEWNAGSRPIFSLWRVGVDGTNPHKIADSGLFNSPLDWKPK
jgi:Tol biopolymer transport system component